MRILVAGCGYVGSALGGRLAAAGHEVWGVRRSPWEPPPGVAAERADLTDRASVDALLARLTAGLDAGRDAGPDTGLDAVVYAAAAGGFDAARYRAAYVEGPRTLLAALARHGHSPRRVLFTSSTGVYPQTGGEWVDETSPTAGPTADPTAGAAAGAAEDGYSSRLLLAGEREVLDGPFPATVARLGGIYGPGRGRLIEEVRRGAAECAPGEWTNRIHRDDAAGALAHLLAARGDGGPGEGPGPLYVVVDEEPAERCVVLDWLAARLGAPPPRRRPTRGTEDAEPPRRARSNKRCSSALLRASGYRFRYPTFREGYGEMLAGDAPPEDAPPAS